MIRSSPLAVLSLLLAISLEVLADGAQIGGVGSGIRAIIEKENLSLSDIFTNNKQYSPHETAIESSYLQPMAVSRLSQILGIYELVSCTVNFDDGSVFHCNQLSFQGDMAITANSTGWQRFALSGYPVIVGSGQFTLSNNTIVVANDIVAGISVIDIRSWDGQYMTTVTSISGATETDTWRRTIAPATPCPMPSDLDSDGVIDSWDKCSSTPPGSYIDSTGCPVSIPKCGNISPVYDLLLDDNY